VHAADKEVVPEKYLNWAIKKKVSPENTKIQYVKFINHHLAKGQQWADWYRAWQKWLGNFMEWNNIGIKRQCNRPNDLGYDPHLAEEIKMWRHKGLTDDQIREKGIEVGVKRD
jgi:hypothetical protein